MTVKVVWKDEKINHFSEISGVDIMKTKPAIAVLKQYNGNSIYVNFDEVAFIEEETE